MPLIFIVSILLFAAIGWCMLSSCMGRPIMAFFSDAWELSVSSARMGSAESNRVLRRRRELGEDDMWEMEHRGHVG
ncbi:hypothetical protein FIBSPDRAFT_852152 [Athelia psychrophila]|uniref:Secreted protein n=1 Tax=Athelia psychrophila TaxID=1759441 RepID=A0A166S156_9AGAM|nr:hypothetical protein FIBSPDRAFT_852152 [Fibularhizoctonia sp. CBS 109695]